MPSDPTQPAAPKQPSRAQRIAVLGFLFAFGLTILTVLLTGLATRYHERASAPAAAAPEPERAP
ncbi:MAG TPA: hypothetical protein VFX89_05615 [Gammaproteobacteria bacterium]|nr:hypothetical protein [Gammaproteobacteria bacterium]